MEKQPTKKLYDEDAYLSEFTAQVLSCEKGEKGFLVVLDRTAFFPEAGGQTPDKGVLIPEETDPAGLEVLDVQIGEESGVITHLVDREIAVGSTVTGHVDPVHRFDYMQQHSGEHIFSGLLCGKYGCDNVGFHLSEETVTMDYNRALTPAEIAGIEQEVNEAIWRDLPVLISWPEDEELARIPYRSKKELSGRIRIVTIPGVDICACCAPHVRHTGEIGLLKVTALQNYKGGVRVTIACGARAFRFLSGHSALLTGMAREMSTAPEEVPGQLKKLREELVDAKHRASLAEEKGLFRELEKLTQDIITNDTITGDTITSDTKRVLLFDPVTEAGSARRVLNEWAGKYSGICGVFLGNDTDGYQYLLAAGHGEETAQPADARECAGLLKDAFGAKGGGSAEMVQGRVSASKAQIRRVLSAQGNNGETE